LVDEGVGVLPPIGSFGGGEGVIVVMFMVVGTLRGFVGFLRGFICSP